MTLHKLLLLVLLLLLFHAITDFYRCKHELNPVTHSNFRC